MFIIFGIVTFLWGFVMLLRLPDSPTNASFLTDEERVIALARLKANKAGYKNNKIEWGQVMEAFTDPKTWFLAVFVLGCNIPNGGYTTVSSSSMLVDCATNPMIHSFQALSSKASDTTPNILCC